MNANTAIRAWLRLLGQGLSLALLRRPRSRLELAGFGEVIACALLAFGAFALQDYLLTVQPAELYRAGFFVHASHVLAVLAIAWLQARVLARPALWLNLAALCLISLAPLAALWNQLGTWLPDANDLQIGAWKLLLAMAGFLVLLRVSAFAGAGSGAMRLLSATALGWLLLAWPWQAKQDAWLWYSIEQDIEELVEDANAAPAALPRFDAGKVADSQQALLAAAIGRLQAQDPARVDLYSIGFAGDGSESVFRNEVDYLGQLLAQRLGSGQRHLSLINHPDSVERTPLATLSNLRAALRAMAGKMDVGQDVLFVYLTSHGSQDHQLKVDLDPIPMQQIGARDLRQALDEAGIGWRVLVVSACYSGGFIDDLKDARTLVITAARHDRSSFGCGADSEITWFGRAFLADALNKTSDLRQAFAMASKQVREWELEAGNTPSVPQMVEGPLIGAQLQKWRAGVTVGETLPFPFAEKADTDGER